MSRHLHDLVLQSSDLKSELDSIRYSVLAFSFSVISFHLFISVNFLISRTIFKSAFPGFLLFVISSLRQAVERIETMTGLEPSTSKCRT